MNFTLFYIIIILFTINIFVYSFEEVKFDLEEDIMVARAVHNHADQHTTDTCAICNPRDYLDHLHGISNLFRPVGHYIAPRTQTNSSFLQLAHSVAASSSPDWTRRCVAPPPGARRPSSFAGKSLAIRSSNESTVSSSSSSSSSSYSSDQEICSPPPLSIGIIVEDDDDDDDDDRDDGLAMLFLFA